MPLQPRILALVGLLLPLLGSAQETEVYRNVPPERLEKILADLDIKYDKRDGPKEGVHFYDFTREKLKVRLHNYGGQDLWLDCIFSDPLTAETVNQWNVKAKFSRAVLLKTGEKTDISLESQIDCLGGVTDPMIRNFITRFDSELRDFVKFISK